MALALCLAFSAKAQEQLDSLKQAALSEKLEEYFMAIEMRGSEVQKEECDFLISSAEDSLVRQFIALKAYDHYLTSPVMGSEAVAIHILDNWFISSKVKMKSEIDLINARVYADFNRSSQIGMPAPQITMQTIDGKEVSLFGDESVASGRFSVLYFYDTDCSKCRIESILLRNILEDNDFPIDFYAIYADDDRKAWEAYADERLEIEACNTSVTHLWDPGLDSDFQRKYGVLQTPRIYLIRPDGIIMGRGLDAENLYRMLRDIFSDVELTYGSDESARLFDGILYGEGGSVRPSVEHVTGLADYISESTLPKGDTLMFRQLSGDMLYYLAVRSGEGIKEGLKYLIDENIKGCPKAWDNADDSLKVIGFAQIMDDLLSKAVPGTQVPSLKLRSELVTSRRLKEGKYNLRKVGGDHNIIIFYTEGCEICKGEKEAVIRMVKTDPRLRALFVNVDKINAEDSAKAGILFNSFDLTSLPYIIETDRKGYVERRYLSYR